VQLGYLRLLQGLSKRFPVRGIRNRRKAAVERLKEVSIVLVGGGPPGDDYGAGAGTEPGTRHSH
jgi:hypothetical protein